MRLVAGYLFAVLRTSQHGSKINRNTSVVQRMVSSSAKYDDTTKSLIEKTKQPFPLIDVDCNLLHEDLTSMLSDSPHEIYQEILPNLRILHHPSTVASNVRGIFSPSSTIDEAEQFHAILSKSSLENRNNIDVRMSVGVHPYHAEEAGNLSEIEAEIAQRISTLMKTDNVNTDTKSFITCIGEAGLDYSEGFPDKEKQLPWFEFQLRLAREYNLPLFLHERLAFDDTVALIDKIFPEKDKCPPIIIHCFTGTKNECEKYIERGYHISVSGYIQKNGDGPEEAKACLRDGVIPMNKLMIETDAPYMGFKGCRESYFEIEAEINAEFQALKSKKRKGLVKGIYPNVPSSLPMVLETTVDLLNEGRTERGETLLSTEDAAKIFHKNSVNFFGIQI
jgi:TatD DNase family protein